MLNIILADAELELVPPEIAGHPAVRKNADKRGKRPSRTLLDSSLHHHAMKGLSDSTRRGRPDITHFFLLLSLDSIANMEGCVRVWVHTRNGEVIHISPETRIPRSASRFFGLMEQLLLEGAVPDHNNPLMRLEERTLEELLSGFGGRKICLDPQGDYKPVSEIFRSLEEDVAVVIGGFADGGFLSPVEGMVDEKISIYPGELNVWTVISEILSSYELKRGILG